MHNNVVFAIAESLQTHGVAALAFNFRGVGRSEGSYDGGAGEEDDARAALSFAAAIAATERLGLAGYSFGAGVAAAIADDSVAAVALVAPPTRRLSPLMGYGGPLLLVAGEMDHVSSAEALHSAAALREASTGVVSVPGVDHFWRGAEPVLTEIVWPFFERSLVAPGSTPG